MQDLAEKDQSDFINMVDSLKSTFKKVHRDLGRNEKTEFSGSTCCTVLLKGRTVYAANLGDSRAILINSNRKVTELTED